MQYDDYLKYKRQTQKVKKTLEHKLSLINKEISIRDIFIYPKDKETSYGEAKNKKTNLIETTLPRLIKQIKLLAKVANETHQLSYCDRVDNTYVLRNECVNKITRLLTNEFFFYTAKPKPLSAADFILLLEAIEAIAKQLHPNVQLLLGTFPVLSDNRLCNMAIYVQGGGDFKVDVFAKSLVSRVDPIYGTHPRFPLYALASGIQFVSGDVATISTRNVFTIKTTGGASYTQAIDVCLEHGYQQAKNKMQQNIDSNEDLELIPDQVDHVLISNSFRALKDAQISDSLVQVDPREKIAKPTDESFIETLSENIIDDELNAKNVKLSNGTITINNPPFGSEFKIVITKERKLAGFNPDMQKLIRLRNDHVKNILANNPLKERTKQQKFEEVYFKEVNINVKIAALFSQLETITIPSFLEFAFTTQNFIIKQELKAILKKSKENFSKLASNPENTSFMYADVLLKNLVFEMELIYKTLPNKIIEQAATEIGNTLNEIAKLVVRFKF